MVTVRARVMLTVRVRGMVRARAKGMVTVGVKTMNLATNKLNRIINYVAQVEESGSILDSSLEILDTCRALTYETDLHRALIDTSVNLHDLHTREREAVSYIIDVATTKEMR